MTGHTAQAIFTPSSYPEHTYVQRSDQRLEETLADALGTPGQISSLIGPSKSGKTVLVEKVVGRDNLIPLSGAELRSSEDVWSRVLDWMGSPSEIVSGHEHSQTMSASVKAGGEVGLPLFAKGKAEASGGLESERKKGTQETRERHGLRQVVRDIANSDFVVLIDDFHYVDRAVQEKIAQECKEAARQGIKICVASVPHRADDVIRANPDLRGRVLSIDTSYWRRDDLTKIADLGFGLLNARVPPRAVERFSVESAGSPQLMQAICLNACFVLNIRETLDRVTDFAVDDALVDEIFRRTCALTNYSSLTDILKRGPKERGVERLTYKFRTGDEGDVYVCILKSLKQDPPRLTFTYEELKRRVEDLCVGQSPRGVGITNSVANMHQLSLVRMPRERAIDWDRERQVLDIVDPYFIFYIRWSPEV